MRCLASPPCFKGRTFGTRSLYVFLIPAQLRKCRVMDRLAALRHSPLVLGGCLRRWRWGGRCAAPVGNLCCQRTACHHLRGGILGSPIGGPRMSPTPRSAKYGATHSCNPCRGSENDRLWSSSPSWAMGRTLRCAMVMLSGVLCFAEQGGRFAAPGFALLRQRFGGAWGALGGCGHKKNRCLSIDSK